MDHHGKTLYALNVALAAMKQISDGAPNPSLVAKSAGQTVDNALTGVDQNGLSPNLTSSLRMARLYLRDTENGIPYDENLIGLIGAMVGIKPEPTVQDTPLNVQVGGDHYKKLAIQPVEYIHANNIPFCEGSAIKYLTRWRGKGGVADLQKAKHFIEMLIDLEGKKS